MILIIKNRLSNILFKYFEIIFGYPVLKYLFKKRLGYDLNLNEPKSFNEKLSCKKIYDKNPLLNKVADKHRVRDYVVNMLGESEAKDILVKQLLVTRSLTKYQFDELPDKFVIKANHGSGKNHIIWDKSEVNYSDLKSLTESWHKDAYLKFYKHEWAYECNEKLILVEEMLTDSGGDIPCDIKFHMIHGKCQFIDCMFDRFEKEKKRSLFSPEWNLLHVTCQPWKWKPGGYIEKPKHLNDMIRYAEKLSSPFDYVRVDFYAFDDKVYFGELTHFPSSGAADYHPQSFDYEIGSKWHFDPDYWKT